MEGQEEIQPHCLSERCGRSFWASAAPRWGTKPILALPGCLPEKHLSVLKKTRDCLMEMLADCFFFQPDSFQLAERGAPDKHLGARGSLGQKGVLRARPAPCPSSQVTQSWAGTPRSPASRRLCWLQKTTWQKAPSRAAAARGALLLRGMRRSRRLRLA